MKIHWMCFDVIESCLKDGIDSKECLIDYFKNNEFVDRYYIRNKLKYSINDLLKTVEFLEPSYYSRLSLIMTERTAILSSVSELVANLEKSVDFQIENELFVILGLDTSTIYSDAREKRSVLCIESIRKVDDIIILISHEFSHWIREVKFGKSIYTSCLGQRLFTEGVACYASRLECAGYRTAEYCLVDEAVVAWVEENWEKLLPIISENYNSSDYVSRFFDKKNNDPTFEGMPNRTGYVIGYLIVAKLVEKKEVLNLAEKDWKIIEEIA